VFGGRAGACKDEVPARDEDEAEHCAREGEDGVNLPRMVEEIDIAALNASKPSPASAAE
jgi:hypothetical protein